MAINDVSLTSGMRSNLLSLQGTVGLLDRTQNRLSTGKKVNTAIDNPVSFFASQALTSRAAVIDSLKDSMGQAVQTITAADKGISAITSLIEQAKGIVQSAQSAQTAATGMISISGLSVGGGYATATLEMISVTEFNVITLRTDGAGGLIGFQADYTADTPEKYLLVDGNMNATASNLANKINARNYTGGDWSYTAQYVAGTNTLDILKYDIGTGLQVNYVAADFGASSGSYTKTVNPAPSSDNIEIGGVMFTATTGVTSGQAFNVSGNDLADMEELAEAINNYAWGATAYEATVTGGRLVLSKTVNGSVSDIVAGEFDASGVTGGGSASMDLVESSAELESLQGQYNTLLDQLTALAEDSGYKGKNLLSEDDLTVKFEGATLSVEGFDASATGLGITAATWATGGDIDADLDLLDASLVTLRRESSKMSGNLSIITVRQGFSTDMMNTLTEGSDKLTLADANEEGGNMLMLQTRQSLSTSALSMSAQAAQSVLRLFQ